MLPRPSGETRSRQTDAARRRRAGPNYDLKEAEADQGLADDGGIRAISAGLVHITPLPSVAVSPAFHQNLILYHADTTADSGTYEGSTRRPPSPLIEQ
jgi:hypothetical protein